MRVPLVGTLLLLCGLLAVDSVHARELTFAQRVEAQAAIERVYHRHRSGVREPFERAVPREVLERKVEDYLRRSVALDRIWDEPVSADALDRELERIAGSTHFPERLEEIYAALGHDGFLIRECFARASFVRRRTRWLFDTDPSIHAAARRRAADLHARLVRGEIAPEAVHPARMVLELEIRSDAESPPIDGEVDDRVVLAPEVHAGLRAEAPERIGEIGPVVERRDALRFRVALSESPGRVRIATYTVEKQLWERWWARLGAGLDWRTARAVAVGPSPPPAPASAGSGGCWTDTVVDPETPSPRTADAYAWTGAELFIWGGFPDHGDGALYDPLLDDWRLVAAANAPNARHGHSAVWADGVVIVWGGRDAVAGGRVNDGSRYDPVTDTWSATSQVGAPEPRSNHTAVWTGAGMIVWGGVNQVGENLLLATGGRYDPVVDTWSATSELGAPTGRYRHAAVWTGTEMVVWGGQEASPGPAVTTGGRYDPLEDTWAATSELGAPSELPGPTVWTGTEMIVWADGPGARYHPGNDLWTAVPSAGAPDSRNPRAVWTDLEMVVWGDKYLNPGWTIDGGSYNPSADTWSPIPLQGAPTARRGHAAVWAGGAMVVWGGIVAGSSNVADGLNTGGVYGGFDPAAPDSDSDGVPDDCDACSGFDDAVDSDGDRVPDGCDICPDGDDGIDSDGDGVPNACDACPWFDDGLDADGDGVPDDCDACPGFDDGLDADGDGVPDDCDACPGFDDGLDADGDGVPDGCDICPGFDDSLDADGDGVPDGCDACPGSHDVLDHDCDIPSIASLAAWLDHDPLKIYLHVRNTFEFEPYFGYLKGPQATLETQRGNDYDLAALTAALLGASGYGTRYAQATAIIPAQAMVEWLGLEDPAAAEPLLNTAGISATPVMSGPVLDHYLVDRVWIEVLAPLRPGDEPAWLPLDPAFKRHDLIEGIPGLLAAVPFDAPTYLSVIRSELTYEFYAGQLHDHLTLSMPGLTVDDVPLATMIRQEDLGSLPRSLPYRLFTPATTYPAIPTILTHTATVRLKHGSTPKLNHQLVLPKVALQRVTLSYAVAPQDQSVVDGFGGLANTPPGLVNVHPQLKLDGQIVAQGGVIPYLDNVTLEIDFFKPEGIQFDGTATHFLRAGEWAAIGIDASQISEAHLQRQVQAIVSALALEETGGTADPDDTIGALLYLAIMQWHEDTREGSETLADLAHFKRWHYVSEGIAFASQEVYTVDGVPFVTVPGNLTVDIPRWRTTHFALDGDNTLGPELRKITGFNGSAQEHAVWEKLLNVPAMSTIKSLQVANEAGIPIFVIDDTDGSSANDCSVLCPQLNLDPTTEATIEFFADNDFIVTVPRDETPLNDWSGVGYIVEEASGDAIGYLFSGGLNLTEGGPASGTNSIHGGAVTVVLEDGSTLVIPAGQLGDAPGQSFAGDPVNIANGNFIREEVDFSIPSRGEPLSFRRFYNSRSTVDVGLGPGWTHHYSDRIVTQPDGSVIWIDSRGTAYTFEPGPVPGTFVSPPGLRETLTFEGFLYRLRRFDGREQTFFYGSGTLFERTDRNGQTALVLDDGNGELIAVLGSGGAVSFTYDAAGRIDTVSDSTERTWTYAYDGDGRLIRVTGPSDAQTPATITEYAYDGEGRLQSITEPTGAVRELRYYANGRVAEVVDPVGGVMTLVYNPFKMETEVTDERGQRSVYDFNANGNLTSLTHPGGSVDRWTYTDNRITSHTDPLGHTEVFEYDAAGNLKRVLDPTGIETLYDYEPPFANLTRVTRPGGRESVLHYDAGGNLLQHIDGAGQVWIADHNAQGFPETVTDGRGATITYAFNAAGQWTSRTTELPSTESRVFNPRGTIDRITDANGHPLIFGYDLFDRVVSVTDAEGNTSEYGYDPAGRLTSITDPRGHTTSFEYDLNDRLVRAIAPDESETRFEYDATGNLVAETDAMGRVTRVEYDPRNRPVKLVSPDGSEVRIAYDAASRIRSITDPLGNTTSFEFDDAGRLTARIDATGQRSEWTYDVNGNLETFLDRRGGLTSYEYDALNRITEIRAPENRIRTADYDANGNLVQIAAYDVLGLGTIPDDPRTLPDSRKRVQTNVYDVLDRLEEILDPEGHESRVDYDPAGNVIGLTDERGKVTLAEYDLANRLTKIIGPDLGEVAIGYDAAGNRTRLETPRGGTYTWSYDNRNRVSSFTDPNGRVTSFDYNLVGNPTRRTHHDGTWVKQLYDPLDRPVLLGRSDGTFTSSSYDPAGNLVRTRTERTDLELTYDPLGRLVSETLSFLDDGFEKTTGYEYDDEGALSRLTDPEGRTIDYARDLAGRITSVTDLAGPTATIGYNGYSERASLGYGNGTAGAFSHDKNGRLTQIDWTNSILNLGYLRDAAGNPTTVTEAVAGLSEVLTVQYDDLSRPISVAALSSPATRAESFAYDLGDNLTNPGDGSTSTFDPADQLTAGAAGLSSYDSRGNRVASDSGAVRLETPHDPSQRITAIRRFTNGVFDHDLSLTRDGLGRLVEIRSGLSARRLLHAFSNPLVEYDAAGSVAVSYTTGDALDDVFAAVLGGTPQYLHRDALNSVRALTGSGGAPSGWRHFGLFGRALESSGAPGFPLGFTGRPFDAVTGLIDLRARFLDPNSGAFLSRDPLGTSLSRPNLFAYAANRPLLYFDPLGLAPVSPELEFQARMEGVDPILGESGWNFFNVSWTGGVPGLVYHPGPFPRNEIQVGVPILDHTVVGMLNTAGNISASLVNVALNVGEALDPLTTPLLPLTAQTSIPHDDAAAFALVGLGRATAWINRLIRGTGSITRGVPSAIPRLSDDIARTFAGGRYHAKVLEQDVIAYRYSGGVSGGPGRFLTTRQTVSRIESPAAAQRALSLPPGATAQQLNSFVIPKGTTIYYGRVASGGETATQIFIQDASVLRVFP